MNLEDLIEYLISDIASEGIGAAAAVGFLMTVFFGGALGGLIVALISSVG